MAVDHNNPQSRDEEILIATIDGTEYNKNPQSRMEELLLELKETIEEGGGGGGTTNYNNLSNQPQVNGETLIGDKTGAELGLVDAEEGKGLSTNDYDDTEKAAVAAATLAISAMKDGSEIDSFGDVEVALLDKADTSDLGTAAAKDSTNAVTAGSTDLVESGAVKDAIDSAVAAAYHHAGTKTVAQLTHDLLIAANEGNVYNITDSGTTTSDFIEGIGKTIDEGSNVGICKVGNVYMFDLLSGFVDTTNFVQKSQTSGLLNNDGTVNTTIEDTVAGHTAAIATKQPITDNTLQTTDKTIPGAINEVKSGLTNVGNDVKLNTQDLTTPSRTKNLLPLTVEGIKTNNTSGTWSGNTYTENGITFTINTDDYRNVTSITANGQNSGSQSLLVIASHFSLFSGSYKLNGCPANGSSSSYEMYCNLGDGTAYDKGESATAVATNDFDSYCTIAIRANYNAQNLVFTPMIRLATETDPAFAPYIPSVESRIEAVESGLTGHITTYDNVTIAAGSTTWVTNLAQNKVFCVYAKTSTVMAYVAEAIESDSLQIYARNFGNDSITTTIYLKEIG